MPQKNDDENMNKIEVSVDNQSAELWDKLDDKQNVKEEVTENELIMVKNFGNLFDAIGGLDSDDDDDDDNVDIKQAENKVHVPIEKKEELIIEHNTIFMGTNKGITFDLKK